MATVAEPVLPVPTITPEPADLADLIARVNGEQATTFMKYLLHLGRQQRPGHDDLYPDVYVCDILPDSFTRKVSQLGAQMLLTCGFPHTRCAGNYVLVASREVDDAELLKLIQEHLKRQG